MAKMTKTELRRHLEKVFENKELISRRDPALNQFLRPGSLANLDMAGKGIEGLVKVGRKNFYIVDKAIDFLVGRADVE